MILARVLPGTRRETLPLVAARRRVAADTIRARHAQPPFDRSPLDGFALHHADTAGATPGSPVRLPVVAAVFAGDAGPAALPRGRAVRIMTGAPIPAGATCVAPQEDVAVHAGEASIPYALSAFDNFCRRGEQVRENAVLVAAGDRVDVGAIGLLAGDGAGEAAVFARPRLGILSTGSELAGPGDALAAGAVHDCNAPLLAARAAELGAEVVSVRTETDDPGRIALALRDLLAEADAVATTGGVSVGERDFLPEAVGRLEARVLFHGVRVKPGKPALAAIKDGKPIICLSGNPFAAFVTFELLAAPVIRRLAGLREASARRVACRLATAFAKRGGQRRFAPGRLVGGEVFFPDGGSGSRSLAALVGANCLVDIPPGEGGLAAGTEAEAILL